MSVNTFLVVEAHFLGESDESGRKEAVGVATGIVGGLPRSTFVESKVVRIRTGEEDQAAVTPALADMAEAA